MCGAVHSKCPISSGNKKKSLKNIFCFICWINISNWSSCNGAILRTLHLHQTIESKVCPSRTLCFSNHVTSQCLPRKCSDFYSCWIILNTYYLTVSCQSYEIKGLNIASNHYSKILENIAWVMLSNSLGFGNLGGTFGSYRLYCHLILFNANLFLKHYKLQYQVQAFLSTDHSLKYIFNCIRLCFYFVFNK